MLENQCDDIGWILMNDAPVNKMIYTKNHQHKNVTLVSPELARRCLLPVVERWVLICFLIMDKFESTLVSVKDTPECTSFPIKSSICF